VERHVHRGDSGNNETPNHMRKPIINSGPGIAKPRQACGIALSQLLLVPVIKPSDEPDLEYQKKQKDCQITSGLWWLGDPTERLRRVKDHC